MNFTKYSLLLNAFIISIIIIHYKINLVMTKTTDACTEQINSCACKTANGYINLEPLDGVKQNGNPKFTGISEPTGSITYSYNPCTAFNEGTCKHVAGCMTYREGNVEMGTQESAKFTTDSMMGTVIQYTNPGISVKTHLQLQCDSTQEGTLVSLGVDDNFNLKLTTKYACSDIAPPPGGGGGGGGGSRGISPGDIMLIVFFVLLAVYFTAGILFNKFHKGARGVELLPNVDFWKALPGLAKDGAKFLWSKIRRKKTGYDDF